MTAHVPGRAPSGVRLAGDDYQHLITWNEVLLALHPATRASSVTVEARDAGSVDDVVVEYASLPTRYVQVKHAVDATTPVGTTWLTSVRPRGRSLLQRFYGSWATLRDHGSPVHMELVTDREIDPHDPLMQLLDRRTEQLVPAIAAETIGSAATAARASWASHLGIEEDELLAMLEHLRFRTGRPYNAELERAESLMWRHGLRTGRQAMDSAFALVREWVQDRWRTLTILDLRQRVEERIGLHSDPGALLVIEAIDNDVHPEDAAERLRWVELYEHDDPNLRRQLKDPGDWTRIVAPELQTAAERLRTGGHRRVLVRGALRLPLWFAAGAALRHVRGFSVAALQHGEAWDSETASGKGTSPQVATEDLGEGPDLAVAVAVATDPTTAVRRFVADELIPAGRLAVLMPPSGPGPEALCDGPAAACLAIGLRDAIRDLLEERPTQRIHLFLAAPGGLALLLGHRWNALAPTIVYEHLGPGRGYAATMTVGA